MRKLLLILSLIAITSLSISANAESGTLTIDSSTGSVYTIAGGAPAEAINFSTFGVDSANYNRIDSIKIVMAGLTGFAKQADSTTFTIISGGVGGGVASYDNTSDTFYWYFDSEIHFVGS